MVRFILFFGIILANLVARAELNAFQPFLNNYSLPVAYQSQDVNGIACFPDQTLLFAMQKGLLKYDGDTWDFLTIPEQPTVIYTDSGSGIVFVGCEKAFGMVTISPKGHMQFVKLTDTATQTSAVLAIASTANDVFFLEESAISCYDKEAQRITKTWKSDRTHYQSLFSLDDDIFVSIEGKGLFQLQDNGIKLVKKGNFGNLLVLHKTASHYLLLDEGGTCYKFSKTHVAPYAFKAQDYIRANHPSCAISIDSAHFAVGTKNAGLVIIGTETGTIKHTVNYQTALPDDEIRCLHLDMNNGIWIGHSSGISRADLQVPIADFSNYPGLKGAVQTSLIHNNILYVGTSQGVFYLTDVKDYKEIEPFTRVEHTKESVESVVKMKKVKKIVRVSFQNKSGKGSVTKDIPIEIEVPTDSIVGIKREKFVSDVIRKQYILKSYPLQFKQIDGLSAKCLHLCDAGKTILAGTNNGLYQIAGFNSNVLLEKAVVRYIEPSINGNYFALSSAGLLSFSIDPSFEIISLNENLAGASSLDFHDNILWITANNHLKKIRVAKGRYFGIEESYPLQDYFPEDNLIATINGLPTVFTYSQSYIFDMKSSELKEIKQLEKYVSIVQRPLVNQQNYFWAKGPECWANLKDTAVNGTKGYLLNMFDHITDIQTDVKGNLWIVSNGRLYKIYGERPVYKQSPKFMVSVNGMSSQTDFSVSNSRVDIASKNLGVEISFSSKYYVSEESSQYRYRLLGLNDQWSDWTEHTVIRYPYIPGGNYVFELESKNVFGQISQSESIEIAVHEPFWEQWWFYLSFGSVLIGSLVYVFAGKTVAAGVVQEG